MDNHAHQTIIACLRRTPVTSITLPSQDRVARLEQDLKYVQTRPANPQNFIIKKAVPDILKLIQENNTETIIKNEKMKTVSQHIHKTIKRCPPAVYPFIHESKLLGIISTADTGLTSVIRRLDSIFDETRATLERIRDARN